MSGEILFLAHRPPFPPTRGDTMRSWNILKALAKLAPVHVAALATEPVSPDDEAAMAEVAASLHLVPHARSRLAAMTTALVTGGSASVQACASPEMDACVYVLMRKRPITAIYAFSGQMAQFVPEPCPARFIMDFVDMDSAKFAEWGQANGVMGWANRREAARLFAHEVKTARRADCSLFVSEAEATLFRQKSELTRDQIVSLENGIDLDRYRPDHPAAKISAAQPLIVFTGQMDYAPNAEAVTGFAKAALPLIQRAHPEAGFAIVGRNPTDAVRALGNLPGVTVTGEVPDTRDWIARADVIVAPLKLARGIQNKVLEAMAMGKPVVATPAAATGIDAGAEDGLIVAEIVAEQAAQVSQLISDAKARDALGKAARARMDARYGWDAQMAGLPTLLGLTASESLAA